jgi:integrase
MKLDAKTTAALGLDGRTDVIHFDDALPGFGYRLRQGAGGKVLRSWIAHYRHSGATRRVLIGSGAVLGAEAAPQAAKKILAKVALGGDPQSQKAERRSKDQVTLRSVIDEYLAVKQQQLRPKSWQAVTRYLADARYFGDLHRLPIDAVTRKHVAAQLLAITRQRGEPTARCCRAAWSAFFAWAMQSGLAESNPVIGTPQVSGRSRERVLSDDELAAVWKATNKQDTFSKIARLILLLGARRAEIGNMCWSEIDLTAATWTLPKERSKNHRAHTLPLPAVAMDLILAVPALIGRDELFGQNGFNSWTDAKTRLDARANLSEPWTLHDLRRTAATRMCDLGIAPHVVEQILNHQSGHRRGVAGTYNRSSYEREVRTALAVWADHVASLDGRARRVFALPSTTLADYSRPGIPGSDFQ